MPHIKNTNAKIGFGGFRRLVCISTYRNRDIVILSGSMAWAILSNMKLPCGMHRRLRSIGTFVNEVGYLPVSAPSTTNNATICLYKDTCDDCVGSVYTLPDTSVIGCVWCEADEGPAICVPGSELDTYCPLDSNQFQTCDTSIYTYIFIVVLAALVCLCCCTCYMRRYRPGDDLLTPLMPSAARHFLWRYSFSREGKQDWMCIICGFDNKTSNSKCSMCGTSHQFSINYKAGKREQQDGKVNIDKSVYSFHGEDVISDVQAVANLQNTWRDADGNAKNADGNEHSPQNSYRENSAGSKIMDAQLESAPISPLRTSRAEREEAFHYRRLNQLSLRQKAGRRRRMWQRVRDEQGELTWIRAPPQKTKVADAMMGYTPRASFDAAAAVAEAAGERNLASTNRYGNQRPNSQNQVSSTLPGEERGMLSKLAEYFGIGSSIERPASITVNHTSSRDRIPREETHVKAFTQLSSGKPNDELREALLNAFEDEGLNQSGTPVDISKATQRSAPIRIDGKERAISTDSFGDSTLLSGSPGYTSVFDEEAGGLRWERVEPGRPVNKTIALPPKTKTRVPKAGATIQDHDPNKLLNSLLEELETVDLIAIAAMTFKEKQLWFLDQMGKLQKQWSEGCIRMELDRVSILRDSMSTFGSVDTAELHKWIRVQFKGEPGVDAGGLEREWFTLIVNELFAPSTGLFTCSSAESMGGAYHINPTSSLTNPELHLEMFTLAGRVIGKAIMEQQAIAATLSLPLRKQILNLPITFSDLEFVDPVLYRNLKFLESYPDIESLSLDFTVSYPVVLSAAHNGKTIDPIVFELKPGGSKVAVTNDNRDEYLQLLLANRMLTSVKTQVEYLLSGLYEIIPPDILSIFDYQELELLLCGVPDIDAADWRNYTEYMGGYATQGQKHKVIRWFWAFVEGCDSEEKAHLLQFITGCSRLPAQGFKALVSNDGKLRKFNIQSISKKDSIYPRSHTCFNKLDLPMYESAAELDAYMSCVTNGDTFGFTIE